MSTILKALQKVEGKGQVKASSVPPDLPLIEKPRGRRSLTWPILLLVGAGALAGGVGWRVYDRVTASIASRALPPAVGKPVDSVPPTSEPIPPATPAGRDPVALPEADTLAIRSIEGPVAPPKQRRPVVETASRPRREQAETAGDTPAAVRPTATGRPRLVVSGIAYQDERAGRLAIVNDRPMGEGENIGDTVISVILKDRVQFSREGETFEIPLTKAGNSRQ